jgi:molybdopterin-guanine dinucleotide biosynthesis protein A
MTPGEIGGLVLAGGAGQRFGQPKASVVFEGCTLVERAVATLQDHCAPVIVASRREIALPPLTVAVCFDRAGPDAPLTGLATGLANLDTEDVVVLACDLPRAAPVVARLARGPAGRATVGRAPDTNRVDRVQPLCARYPRRSTLEACEELLASGETRLLPLVDALRPLIIDASAVELSNVNSPVDLVRLARLSPPPRSAC